jgi:hypothetical protein
MAKDNAVLARLEARKKAKAEKEKKEKEQADSSEGATQETEQEEGPINPPEGVGETEPPDESEKPKDDKKTNSVTGKPRKERTQKAKSTTKSTQSPPSEGGVILRALEAAWEVLAEDIARRVKDLT